MDNKELVQKLFVLTKQNLAFIKKIAQDKSKEEINKKCREFANGLSSYINSKIQSGFDSDGNRVDIWQTNGIRFEYNEERKIAYFTIDNRTVLPKDADTKRKIYNFYNSKVVEFVKLNNYSSDVLNKIVVYYNDNTFQVYP